MFTIIYPTSTFIYINFTIYLEYSTFTNNLQPHFPSFTTYLPTMLVFFSGL